jgi:phage gp29-like protein
LVPAPEEPFYRRRAQGRFNFLQHIEEALDSIAYGFEPFEQVGYIGKDGLFHYKKLALRPAHTVTEIIIRRDGGIQAIRQGGLIDGDLDINRLVVYSFQRRGANWHGRSLLRGCYEPWLLKDRAVRVGVMNLQRAGVGVPIATGPPGATETDLKILNRMMTRLVAGDRSGGAVPHGADVRLIGVEGGQPDTVEFVKLMNEEMARSFFQMFMQLGQTTSGSRALGTTFVEYHKLVTEYIAQWFAAIFNEHVIEDDIDWNWGPEEEFCPLLEWKWDEEGSDRNPEGPTAAGNPAQAFQNLAKDGKINTDDATKAMLNV